MVHRTALVSPLLSNLLISILWPRPRRRFSRKRSDATAGRVRIIFHRSKSFSSRINERKNHGSMSLRWNSWQRIFQFSRLFKNLDTRLIYREIIEEIIRYTRRRYLKDCSTLCRRLPGQEISITANFGSWNTNIDTPSLPLPDTEFDTHNHWIVELLHRRFATSQDLDTDSFEVVTHRGTKRIFSPWIPILGSSYA